MKRIQTPILTFLASALLFYGAAKAQQKPGTGKPSLQQFYSLFTEIEFNVQHVYTDCNIPATFPPENTYPYNGKEIDTSFHYLLSGVHEIKPGARLFATHRFFISASLEALLIRDFRDPVHYLHYLVFDNTKNTIIKDLEIAYLYCYHGSFGRKESWIIDVNRDGQKDLVTISWEKYQHGSEELYYGVYSAALWVWKGNELLQIPVTDDSLLQNLKHDFPFYSEPELGFHTRDQLDSLFKNNPDMVTAHYDEIKYWFIIIGNYKSLAVAKNDMAKAKEVMGLNSQQLEINKIDELYNIVIRNVYYQVEAEIGMRKIKNNVNDSAWIIKEDDWCKNLYYNNEGYYDCVKK